MAVYVLVCVSVQACVLPVSYYKHKLISFQCKWNASENVDTINERGESAAMEWTKSRAALLLTTRMLVLAFA